MPDLPQPWPASQSCLRIGTLEIDLRYRRLRHPDGDVELTQRVFDLLLLFLREPLVLHTRTQIFDRVWPGVVVEDANLTQSVWLLRKALGNEAKEWLRTVSKQGYVFEPPLPIERIDATMPLPPIAPLRNTLLPLPRPRPWRLWLGVLVLGVIGCALWWQTRAAAPRRVVLVTSADAALSEEASWPVELLHIWLEWKLRAIPSLQLIDTRSNEPSSAEDTVVLLNVAMPANAGADWQISARLRGGALPHDFVRSSTAATLVPALDALSRDVQGALAPDVAAQSWPALALPAAAASQFVAAIKAEQRHRRGDAVQAYRAVLALQPDFGYARFKLADNLAELGQQSAAETELAQAQTWLATVQAPAHASMAAQALAIRQEFDQAAAAFKALASNDAGEAASLRLAQARNLRRAGRSAEAVQRLASELPTAPGAALSWMIERARAELAVGDAARARQAALDAVALATRLGWDHERADALLLQAEAAALLGLTVEDVFVQAQRGFEAAGDRLGALRARVLAEILGAASAVAPAHLDELLAEARAAGNATVEIDALRRTAFLHFRAGDLPGYRERLAQAVSLAEASGNRHSRNVAMLDLLHQDVLRGDPDAAERRLSLLRAQPMQGVLAFWVGVFSAGIDLRRGNYAAAAQTLDQTEANQRRADTHLLPAQAAGLACLRGSLALARGDAAAARVAFERCREPHLPYYSAYADGGDAEVAMDGGDRQRACQMVESARKETAALNSAPDRWLLTLTIAPLQARCGDFVQVEQLLREQLSSLEHAGYVELQLDTHLALAEIALAQSQRAIAQQAATRATALVRSDDWQGQRRLRTITAVLDQTSGEITRAARGLEALDAQARERGDVLAELLAHSLVATNPEALHCDAQRHAQLLAQSGMRGASDTWLLGVTAVSAVTLE